MSFVVLRKIVTLKIIYFTLLLLLINANNDRFAVLCNRYFSECDWRFIWCQFVADVKENPGGFQSQLNIDGLRYHSCNRQHFVHHGRDSVGLS